MAFNILDRGIFQMILGFSPSIYIYFVVSSLPLQKILFCICWMEAG